MHFLSNHLSQIGMYWRHNSYTHIFEGEPRRNGSLFGKLKNQLSPMRIKSKSLTRQTSLQYRRTPQESKRKIKYNTSIFCRQLRTNGNRPVFSVRPNRSVFKPYMPIIVGLKRRNQTSQKLPGSSDHQYINPLFQVWIK